MSDASQFLRFVQRYTNFTIIMPIVRHVILAMCALDDHYSADYIKQEERAASGTADKRVRGSAGNEFATFS